MGYQFLPRPPTAGAAKWWVIAVAQLQYTSYCDSCLTSFPNGLQKIAAGMPKGEQNILVVRFKQAVMGKAGAFFQGFSLGNQLGFASPAGGGAV